MLITIDINYYICYTTKQYTVDLVLYPREDLYMSKLSKQKSARHRAGRRKLRQPVATASTTSTMVARQSTFIHPFRVDQLAHSEMTQDELELMMAAG